MRKDIIKLILLYITIAFVAVNASGCSSSAGGRFYCGFEEINGIKETKTYDTEKVKK